MTVEDLHLLRINDLGKVEELLQNYQNVGTPREAIEVFRHQLLTALNAWFVEVGDVGLIYLTDIIPTFSANVKVIFWDRKLGKLRRDLIRKVIATAFAEFELTRVQALVPSSNVPLAEYEFKKIGFTQEGLLRKAWREAGEDVDLVVYGVLREEAGIWEPIPHLMITSVHLT